MESDSTACCLSLAMRRRPMPFRCSSLRTTQNAISRNPRALPDDGFGASSGDGQDSDQLTPQGRSGAAEDAEGWVPTVRTCQASHGWKRGQVGTWCRQRGLGARGGYRCGLITMAPRTRRACSVDRVSTRVW